MACMNKERVNLTVDAWIMTEARRAAEQYDMTLSRLVSEGIALRIAQLDAATHSRQLAEAGFNTPERHQAEAETYAEDSAAYADARRRGAV